MGVVQVSESRALLGGNWAAARQHGGTAAQTRDEMWLSLASPHCSATYAPVTPRCHWITASRSDDAPSTALQSMVEVDRD